MFQPLSSHQSFSPGADLWILPFEPETALFRKINWRVGFLLRPLLEPASHLESPSESSPESFPSKLLQQTHSRPFPSKSDREPQSRQMEKQESGKQPSGQQLSLELEPQERESALALLIPTGKIFPSKLLLCLALEAGAWIPACHRRWIKLGRPSLRIFLPRGLNERHLREEWPEKNLPLGKSASCPLLKPDHAPRRRSCLRRARKSAFLKKFKLRQNLSEALYSESLWIPYKDAPFERDLILIQSAALLSLLIRRLHDLSLSKGRWE